MKSKKTGHLLALLLVTLFVTQGGNLKAHLDSSDKITDVEQVAAQPDYTGKVVHVIETQWNGATRFYAVEMHASLTAAHADAQNTAYNTSTIVGFLDPNDSSHPKFFRLHKAANGSVTYDKAFPPFLPVPSATINDAVGVTPPGHIRSKKSAGTQQLTPAAVAGTPLLPAAVPLAPTPARVVTKPLSQSVNHQTVIAAVNAQQKNIVILKSKSTNSSNPDAFYGLEVFSKAEVAGTAENNAIFAFEDDDGTIKFVRRNARGQFIEPFPPFTQGASLDAAAKAADFANPITHHKKAADGGLTAGEPVRLLTAPIPARPARTAGPARVGAPLSIQDALDVYKRFVESQTDSAGARLKLNTDFEAAIRNFDRANPPTPADIAEIETHLKKLQKTDGASQDLIRNIQRTVIQKLSADTSGSQAPDHWTSVGWVNIIKDYRDEEATALALKAALDTINPTKKAVSAKITELHKAAEILLQKYPVITYNASGNKKIRYNISDQEATDLTTALEKLPLIEDKATRAQLNTTLSEIETAMRNHFSAAGYKIPSWPETAKGGQIKKAKTDLEVAQAAVEAEANANVDPKTGIQLHSATHRAAFDLVTKVLAINFAKKTRWTAAEKADLTETMRKLKMYSENAMSSTELKKLFAQTESFVKTHMIVQNKTLDDVYDTKVTAAISGKQDDVEVADTFEISKPKNVRTIGKIQRPGWFKRNILRVDTPEEAALKIARKNDTLAADAYENAQQLKDARKKAKVKVFWTKGDDNLRQHYSDLTGQIDTLQRQHAIIIAEHAKIRTATAAPSKERREALERQQALAILANKLAQSHEKLMQNKKEVFAHLDKEGTKRRAALGIDDRDNIAALADTIDDAAGVDGAALAPARRTLSLEEFAAQAEAKQKYKQFIAFNTRAGSGEAAAHTNIMKILDADPSTPAAAYQAARKAMEERIKTHRVDSDTAIAEALTATLEKAKLETLAQKAWRDKAKIQREESVAALQKAQSELKRALAPQPPPRARVPQAAPSFKGAVPGTAAGVAAHAQPPRAPNPGAGRRVAAPARR